MEKILFCATDAGGARNLAPVITAATVRGYKNVLVAGSGLSGLFPHVDETYSVHSLRTLAGAAQALYDIKPVAVICGTTRYLSPERLLVKTARQNGSRSAVILDEWFNYRLRFTDENNLLTFLPDVVCCQNKQAAYEAAEAGVPKEILTVTGSPALAALTAKAETYYSDPPPLPAVMNGVDEPSILFLSENHAADYGERPGETGPLGDYIGYTELEVRQDIYDVLQSQKQSCIVLEKIHPEGLRMEQADLGDDRVKWSTITDTDLWPLLWYSDLVIGMRSMALLESVIMGCNAVSYQPGLIGPNECTSVRLGLVKNISTKEELSGWLKDSFKSLPGKTSRRVRRFDFAPVDAAEQVLAAVMEG